MQSRFKQSKLFFRIMELTLMTIDMHLVLQMPNILGPISKMLSTISLPLLAVGFIHYMFDPIVAFLGKRRIPRMFDFLLTFLIVTTLVVLAVMNAVSQLMERTIQLTQNLPVYTDGTSKRLNGLAQREEFKNFNLKEQLASANLSLSNLFNIILVSLSTDVPKVISFTMQFFILLFTAPFILLFMLEGGHKFVDALFHFFPKTIRKELRQTVKELNETLSIYTGGATLNALTISAMSLLVVGIFDQPYSSLLAAIYGITNIIPHVGPFIEAVPAIIVGLLIPPFQALYITLPILVIQQSDGNLIKPSLPGKSMNIHPPTIILVLIGAEGIAGILGMLICISVYAVIKTMILSTRKIYLLRRMEHVSEKLDSPKIPEETSG